MGLGTIDRLVFPVPGTSVINTRGGGCRFFVSPRFFDQALVLALALECLTGLRNADSKFCAAHALLQLGEDAISISHMRIIDRAVQGAVSPRDCHSTDMAGLYNT